MTEEPGRPLRAVIGEGVRRVREAAGVQQDTVSRAARIYGLTWDRSRVGVLERGEKAISSEELVLLPLVLAEACRRPVKLSDLIAPDTRVELSPTISAAGYMVPKILGGDDLDDLPAADLDFPTVADRMYPGQRPDVAGRKVQVLWERSQTVQDRLRRLAPDGMTAGEFSALLGGVPSEAEHKAAKRLAEDPHVILGLSSLLWGRSLAEERDRLVDEQHPDASVDRRRALRGRVTRQLVDQMAAEIRRRETRGDGERQEEAGR